jgi:hypothetical protein
MVYAAVSLALASVFCQTAPLIQAHAEDERRLPEVDFVKDEATLTEAIKAIALQTRAPIGVILGRDKTGACSSMYKFDLHEIGTKRSLETVAREAQYTVSEENGVVLVTDPDVTPRQRMVLDHRFAEFKTDKNKTMPEISADLAGWLWSEVDHGTGWVASVLGSMDDPRISLPASMPNISAEAIANRVVMMGAGGIWIAKISPDRATGPEDDLISFYSYGNPERFKSEISCGP